MIEAAFPEIGLCAQFHAAAVAGPAGAVLLRGRKGCGKTTLTAALLDAGFDYLTDDVVLMDTHLNVVSLPLGLSLKKGSWSVLEQTLPDLAGQKAEKIGGEWVKYLPVTVEPRQSSGLRIGAIVFPRFQAGACPELRRLAPLECLQLLTESGAWFSLRRRAPWKWASWLNDTPSYSLQYSRLDDAIERVREVAV